MPKFAVCILSGEKYSGKYALTKYRISWASGVQEPEHVLFTYKSLTFISERIAKTWAFTYILQQQRRHETNQRKYCIWHKQKNQCEIKVKWNSNEWLACTWKMHTKQKELI